MDNLRYICVCFRHNGDIEEHCILSVEELIGEFTIIGGEIENGYVLLGKRNANDVVNAFVNTPLFENFEKEENICDDIVLIKTNDLGDPIDLYKKDIIYMV